MASRILVVDDDKSIRELLKVKLSKAGYEVMTAQDGKEFRQRAFEGKPDLIVLDILLGNDGVGPVIYDELIKTGFDSSVPVIFVSALVDEAVPSQTHDIEGRKFALYGKPFDFDLLLDEIKGMVENTKNGKDTA